MLSWHALPNELQHLIVIELAGSFDTIHELSNLFLVSKSVHDRLVGAPSRGITEDNRLYFLLFMSMYDDQAVKRRLKIQLTPVIYTKELKERCQLLKRIRSGSWRDFNSNDLWRIYLMLLDDDGKNLRQLQLANVKQFLLEQVLTRIQNDLLVGDGWPEETTYLQLSAASFAIVSDREDALHEAPEVTERIYNYLEQIYIASHRYPYTQLPVTAFHRDDLLRVPTVQPGSLRTIATLPSFPASLVVYFGQKLSLVPPSLACSATLILTNRRERRLLGLYPNRPVPHADQEMRTFRAMAIGVEVPPAGSGRENPSGLLDSPLGSRRWDHAFARMLAVADITSADPRKSVNTLFKTMYYPGMYSGKWLGRILLPDVRFMVQMTNMHPAPYAQVRDAVDEDVQQMSVWDLNFYAELREHLPRDEVVGCGLDEVAGYRNGYFPDGIDPIAGHNFVEKDGGVFIKDPNEPDAEFQTKHYRTLSEPFPEQYLGSSFPLSVASSPTRSDDVEMSDDDINSISDDIIAEFDRNGVGVNEDTIDVIITGETDAMHGSAWGDFRFYGRIRKLDGLLVIIRACPSDPEQGRWVFAGNMHLANTIVGLCRQCNTNLGETSLQGPFIISKIGNDL